MKHWEYLPSFVAGFPSPAENWAERPLHLETLFVPHPEATFFVRVDGNSMAGAGIADGDLLVVDRALEAVHRSIIVAMLHGRLFTVKRLLLAPQGVILASENPKYPPFHVTPQMQFRVWGVVLFVIHPVHPLASRHLEGKRKAL